VRCIEAQVMDLSDDIAYSVHDFEDAIVSGYLDVPAIASHADHDALLAGADSWSGGAIGTDALGAAFERLERLPGWLTSWSGTRPDLARLKNLTSTLIGRFAGHAERATRVAHPEGEFARFGASVVVPAETRAEIALLKGIVGANVMSADARQPVYSRQRQLLTELCDALWATGPQHLDAGFAADWAEAADDDARRRVVVDQVASLTDHAAESWHERLC